MSSSCALIGPGLLHLVWTRSCFFHGKILSESFCEGLTKRIEQGTQWPDCIEYEKKQTRGRFGLVCSQNSHACASEECV